MKLPYDLNDLLAGTLEIGEYDQSDWGAPCEQCLFTFCKKTVMNIFIKGKTYEEIKYFGDGPNDLHPAQALSEKDKVFPRKGYPLRNLISSKKHNIKAEVYPWMDGSEILKNL